MKIRILLLTLCIAAQASIFGMEESDSISAENNNNAHEMAKSPHFFRDLPHDISNLIVGYLTPISHSDSVQDPEKIKAMVKTLGRLKCVDTWSKEWVEKDMQHKTNDYVEEMAQKYGLSLEETMVKYNVLFALANLMKKFPEFAHNENGVNSLMTMAIRYGYCRMSNCLLANGAQVTAEDMLFAARHGKVDILELFLRHGVDVNIRKKEGGWTVLMDTASNAREPENAAVMCLLIKHGADVNAQDTYGNTALKIAAEYNFEGTKLLLDNGARTDGRYGKAALRNARVKRIKTILKEHGAKIE